MPTVTEAGELKVKLEKAVTYLVVQFEEATGLQVTGLHVPMFRRAGEEKEQVQVSARLP